MIVATPATDAGPVATAGQIAQRTGLQLLRTPQVLGIAIVQSVVFLLMFRYVFGGAIGVEGVPYVDFLVPGFVVAGLIFTAGGSAVAIAEDAASGVHDRLRSLPVRDLAVLTGRALADTGLMLLVALVTLALGVAVGFRLGTGSGAVDLLAAIGLVAVYAFAFAWVFAWLGLASGSAQAAQGLGIIGVPFSFLSSAFVPVESMPGVLEAFAEHQPLTFMIDAVRGLLAGDAMTATLDHALSYYVVGSLLWSLALVVAFAPLAIRAYRAR